MSARGLRRRLVRLERQRPPTGEAAFILLEAEGDELPAWAARAPVRAIIDLREHAGSLGMAQMAHGRHQATPHHTGECLRAGCPCARVEEGSGMPGRSLPLPPRRP